MAYQIYLCCVLVLGWNYDYAQYNGKMIERAWDEGRTVVYLSWWPPDVTIITAANVQASQREHRRLCGKHGGEMAQTQYGMACVSAAYPDPPASPAAAPSAHAAP